MTQYLFFDLDHTLWDCDRNAQETLDELHQEFELEQWKIPSGEKFWQLFDQVNHELWLAYEAGKIAKSALIKKRFPLLFKNLGLSENLPPLEMGLLYEERSPYKTHLVPHTQEVLRYLQPKYQLCILTNGQAEQRIKMEASQIKAFFSHIFTSEDLGYHKPETQAFEIALEQSGASVKNTIMIGDSLRTDIEGANRMEMKSVFLNRKDKVYEGQATYEIRCLSELLDIL